MGATALIGLAGLGLGAYGAYNASAAQGRQEDKYNEAQRRQDALAAERRASFQRTMDELRGNIQGFTPQGYSPEELKTLEDKVNFDTGEKGRDLSTSLIQSVLGRNVNPASGAVTEAAAKLAGQLTQFKTGKLLDINAASLAQKKAEELAKRNAMTSYLSAYDKGVGGINESDLSLVQNDLANYNQIQGQKGKQFSDLSSALLSSIGDIDTKDPLGLNSAGKGIGTAYDYLKGLLNKKKKPIETPALDTVPYAK